MLSAPNPAAQRPEPPLTMGRLAIMAGTADTALLGTLRAALADGDPGLRFVAARIARASRVPAVEPDLASALSREGNVWVAAEMTRALLMIDTPTSRSAAEAGLDAAPARAAAYATWLARTAPDQLIAQMPRLATALGDAAHLEAPISLAAAQHPDLRHALLRAATAVAGAAPWIDTLASATVFMRQPSMRSVDSPWPGLLTSLMDETRCSLGYAPAFGRIAVAYRGDGRIAFAKTDVGSLPTACAAMLPALARVVMADDEAIIDPDAPQWLLVPGQRDAIACADRALADPGARLLPQPTRDAADRVAATLVRSVDPVYPSEEMRAKHEGSVEMTAMVSAFGCVRRVWVMQALTNGLDGHAVSSALRWQFKPMLVRGLPADSIVTILVEFKLAK